MREDFVLVPDVSNAAPIVDIWQPAIKQQTLRTHTNSWIPLEHRRRLAAYKVYAAVYNNSHKNFMQRQGILEFGDAALVADTLRDALIGVSGIKITADDLETNKTSQAKVDRLRKWWREELMDSKVFENETNCTVLGDSVYRLRMSNKVGKKKTVKVDTFDPGFFFPDFDDDGDLSKVHLAWEEEYLTNTGEKDTRVYKETYSLYDNKCFVTAGYYQAMREGRIGDEWFNLDDLELISYKVDASGVVYDNVDLQIDFIPIIYIPNINVQGEPFGKSDLAKALDIFSEIANSNTDMAANTSLLGSPPLVLKSDASYGGDVDEDGQPRVTTVGPGQVIEVGPTGDAFLLEVHNMNTAIDSYLKGLDKRLFEVTRATKLAAGKMEGSVIPSGISLRLMQNPLVQATLPKRILRTHKFLLLLKFVQKLLAKFGEPEDMKVFADEDYSHIDVEFSDIFPTDRSQAINDLAVAYTAGFLSLETAVRMGNRLGIDIDDVKKEVERIKKEREEMNTFVNTDGTQHSNSQRTSDGEMMNDGEDE